MKVLGIDIGTTTISAVILEDEQLLYSLTLPGSSFICTKNSWEKVQDTEYIIRTCLNVIETLTDEYKDIERIGITGQMHGILYINAQGKAVSNLYTWQDGRGELPYSENASYAHHFSSVTGYSLSTGYGITTHCYNIKNGLVPHDATGFCTIHDYLAMELCGLKRPVTDPSDAASLGLFNVEKLCFDLEAVDAVGIDSNMLPIIASEPRIGFYRNIPVCVAIGDNQASFIGACSGNLKSMLINVGTSSQFSVYSAQYTSCNELDTRPFPGGGYLLVGAALCGGRAYALLEKFMRDTATALCGQSPASAYETMEKLLSQGKPDDIPVISPLFQGTRMRPELRGSIVGLSSENLTPQHLTWAMLYGMAQELHNMYQSYTDIGGIPAALIGSGNGLRKNKYLQDCIAELFGQPLKMSDCREEAAVGAARYALMN